MHRDDDSYEMIAQKFIRFTNLKQKVSKQTFFGIFSNDEFTAYTKV